MKLHLPIGLRRALYAVFAVLQSATVAFTLAPSSAQAETIKGDSNVITGEKTTETGDLTMQGPDEKNWIGITTETNAESNTIDTEAEVTVTNGSLNMYGGTNAIKGTVDAGGNIAMQKRNLGSADQNTISGSATAGNDIAMKGSTNTISGTATAEAGNINMTGSDEVSSTGGSNTITGTATAKGNITMQAGKTAWLIRTGSNTIATGAQVDAGGTVTIEGLQNTVKGTVTGGTGVKLGEARYSMMNTLTGSVTATSGDITVAGVLNSVNGGLDAKDGSITLGAQTIAGSNLLKYLVPALGDDVVALLKNYGMMDADGNVDLNVNGNIIDANADLDAAKTVTISGMFNAATGGKVSAGTGVSITGGYNVLTGMQVETATGGISMTADNSAVGKENMLTTLANNYVMGGGMTAEQQEAMKGLIAAVNSGANVMLAGGLKTTESGDITLVGKANMLVNGIAGFGNAPINIEATNGNVLLDSSLNAAVGTNISGTNITFEHTGTEYIKYGDAINSMLVYLGDQAPAALEGILTEEMVGKLNGIKGSMNVILGWNTATKVTAQEAMSMTGAVNLIGYNTKVTAENGDLTMTGTLPSNGASISMNDLVGALGMADTLEPLQPYMTQLGLDTMMSNNLTANVVMSAGSLSGKNIVLSGTSTAELPTTHLNVVANGSHLTAGETVTIKGDANILTSFGPSEVMGMVGNDGTLNIPSADGSDKVTITAGNTITLDSTANVVHGLVDITSTGGDIIMTGSEYKRPEYKDVTAADFAIKMGLITSLDDLAAKGKASLMARLGNVLGQDRVDAIWNQAVEMGLADKIDGVMEAVVTEYANRDLYGMDYAALGNMVTSGANVSAAGDVTMTAVGNMVTNNASVNAGGNIDIDGAVNVMAGGAKLNAGSDTNAGNITMTGTANMIIDTTLRDMMGALDGDYSGLMQGGSKPTVLTATGNIELDALANVVSGQAQLAAGADVKFSGGINYVTGAQAKVTGTNITMGGTTQLELDLTQVLDGYINIISMTDNGKLDKGVNLNVVGGGATLNATGDITMNGTVSMVVDTTLSNVMDLIQGDVDGFMAGGVDMTTVSANNIKMQSIANIVNGRYVSVNAGEDMTMSGMFNAVGGNPLEGKSTINAGGDINMSGVINGVANGAVLTADNITMKGNAHYSAQMGHLVGEVVDGLDLAGVGSASGVLGEGTLLQAKNNVSMLSNLNMVAEGAKLEGATAKMAGTINTVLTGADVSATNGNVTLQGTAGTAVLEGGKVSATGNVTIEQGIANAVINGSIEAGGNVIISDLGAVPNGMDSILSAVDGIVAEYAPEYKGYFTKLGKVANLGSVNVVAGAEGLVSAEGNISMDAMANMVALGGKLEAGGDITMSADGTNGTTVANYLPQQLESKIPSMLDTVVQGNIVADAGSVNAGGSVTMEAEHNLIRNATVTAGKDININGGESTLSGATLKAEGSVKFNGATVTMTNGSLTAKGGMNVTGSAANPMLRSEGTQSNLDLSTVVLSGESTYDAGSVVSIDDLTLTDGSLENCGELSIEEALLTNATVHNAGAQGATMAVAGNLTMNSVTLTFDVVGFDSDLSAIDMVGTGSLSIDGPANIIFTIDDASLASATIPTQEFTYVIFENVTDIDGTVADLSEALTLGSVTFTGATITEYEVTSVGSSVVITGTIAVPEPTTATLSLLALAALAARRRRR